jgi:hypothetical protein
MKSFNKRWITPEDTLNKPAGNPIRCGAQIDRRMTAGMGSTASELLILSLIIKMNRLRDRCVPQAVREKILDHLLTPLMTYRL